MSSVLPTIRLATPDDVPQLVAIYAPIVAGTAISFELETPSVEEVSGRVERTLEQWPWLVCHLEGRVAGYAYGGGFRARPAYRWSVEVSAYVGAEFRRRRVARGLYTALLRLLTLQGYVTAYAGVALPNDASLALHREMGFQSIGVFPRAGYKLGRWHDVEWLYADLAGPTGKTNPSPPVPLPTLIGQPEMAAALAAGGAVLRR